METNYIKKQSTSILLSIDDALVITYLVGKHISLSIKNVLRILGFEQKSEDLINTYFT